MKMTKRILVIEDTYKHRTDAERFFEGISDLEVEYAETYSDASKIMLDYDRETWKNVKGSVDGVISDIYFPLTDSGHWTQPEPIGVRVAIELETVGMPFVLNTAGYHHGSRYEWINSLARDRKWPLVDASSDYHREGDTKSWAEAWKKLEERMR